MDLANDLVRELPANAFLALWVVPLLQKLKNSDAKWLRIFNQQTAPLWSGILAVVAALGIHTNFTFNPDGSFQAVVDGSIVGVIQGGFEIAKQFTAQHWVHKGYKLHELLVSGLQEHEREVKK